jgi:hypothetical protein
MKEERVRVCVRVRVPTLACVVQRAGETSGPVERLQAALTQSWLDTDETGAPQGTSCSAHASTEPCPVCARFCASTPALVTSVFLADLSDAGHLHRFSEAALPQRPHPGYALFMH